MHVNHCEGHMLLSLPITHIGGVSRCVPNTPGLMPIVSYRPTTEADVH